MNRDNPLISIICPCWHDAEAAWQTARTWATHPAVREIILAGVIGAEPKINGSFAPKLKWCASPRPGRGPQLNLGARLATAEVLLFNHVDSELTEAHLDSLACAMNDPALIGGGFYRRFDERHPGMRWAESIERAHCRTFGTIYGDQSVFVRREVFARLGGFAPIPLMEDVEFSRRLRRAGKIVLLDPPMRSSPQRQIEHGAWRVTLRNLSFLIAFRAGVSPERLHRRYYNSHLGRSGFGGHRPPLQVGRWRARWRAFRQPVDAEKTRVLRERWNSLPPELQTPNQISGRHLTHCGFILGASYCSFHCTHCYLPKNANRVPIPSLAEVKEQIDANRRLQGPGAGLQITGGDVADAYWKSGRVDELVEIVRYAYAVGLVPMLMTHGQTLLEHPEFLERLVIEGGLRQISVHIDITQAGRHGFPIGRVESEADLHPVRQAFTDLAWSIRHKTGRPLEYALSFTVTQRNLRDVPEVIRWYLADPKRTYIWRMLSFQPEADTGRTHFSEERATPEAVWQKICDGTGLSADRYFSLFGHPDCNNWYPLLVSQISGRHILFPPQDKRTQKLFGDVLARIGGVSFMRDDAGTTTYRVLGLLAQHPWLMLRLLGHALRLALNGQVPFEFTYALLTGRAHSVGTGTHNFMDAKQVANADNDPVVKARLEACVFKGAVKENGKWRAVPMCSMNQQTWAEIYEERLSDAALMRQRQVWSGAGQEDLSEEAR